MEHYGWLQQIVLGIFGLIKGVSWPAVFLILGYRYKAELIPLFRRLLKIGLTGAEFAPPQEQQNPGDVRLESTPDQLSTKRPTPDSPAIRLLEQPLNVSILEYPENQRLQVLVANLAQAQLYLGHERIYRKIFGSQIRGLRQLNAAGMLNKGTAQNLFDNFVTESNLTEFYRDYGFDGWIKFLVNNQLVDEDNELLSITEYGRDFLIYLTAMRLADEKPG